MYACQMEKIKSGIICVVKNIGKGHRNPFPKSAQTTKKCSFDNSKSAHSTKRCSNDKFHEKHCILTEKFCVFFLALNDILLTLGKTKIINASLYDQKNHFSYLVSVADDGNFSCHCAAENRHNLHLPLRSAEGHVLRSLEWQ